MRGQIQHKVGSKQGFARFPAGPCWSHEFYRKLSPPWNLGPAAEPFEPPLVGQGDYGRSMGVLPL